MSKPTMQYSDYTVSHISSTNRDDASYTLSHTHDRFLATSHHYRRKNRNNYCEQVLLTKVSDRDRNAKVNKVRL